MKKTFLTLLALTITVGLAIPNARAVSSTLVIAEVYGGGGNSGAAYRNDFIVIFNRGSTSVDVNGWSVQYASSTGSTWSKTGLATSSMIIPPGGYFLVQEAQGAGGTLDLPTPDATGTIAIAATAGKVALCNSTTALSGSCPTGGSVIDFVGFGATANCYEGAGPTPAPSNTTSVQRGNGGCTDTENSSADFTSGSPNPLNSASPANVCGESQVKIMNIQVAGGTVTINFTAGAGDSEASFDVVSSGAVNGAYTPASAVITNPSSGNFQATVATAGSAQFYRIKRN